MTRDSCENFKEDGICARCDPRRCALGARAAGQVASAASHAARGRRLDELADRVCGSLLLRTVQAPGATQLTSRLGPAAALECFCSEEHSYFGNMLGTNLRRSATLVVDMKCPRRRGGHGGS